MLDSELSDQDRAALLIPCRMHVYVEGGEVWVGAIRPTLSPLFPEARDRGPGMPTWRKRVVGLVDSAVG